MRDSKQFFTLPILVAMMFVVASVLAALPVNALNNGSLLLGDPRTGETSTYTFSAEGFTTATAIRCIDIALNDQADGGGGAIPGITTTSSTLASATLITPGSWTVDNTQNSRLRITNTGGEAPILDGEIEFGNITNGNDDTATYYAILTTYTDVGCSTPSDGVDSIVVAFTYNDGELVQLTIDPTLTFSVEDVASSQPINGESTTVATTATGINFNNAVTTADNGVSAHDIEVGTNATAGYSVYIRHTGDLSNGTDSIANHAGTNAAPTPFPTAGSEAWGYTTEDSTLAGITADRFTNPGNEWAGFTTSNEVVADNTSGVVGTETTRVGHQVGIASTTPAGTYQTTIVYTVVSTY